MVDGRLLIEKLISYAKENLELSDYDVSVKRNLLMKLLNVAPAAPAFFDGQAELSGLQTELYSFAKENSLCGDGDEAAFFSFIVGTLMPLPSAINKKFVSLREKLGSNSACNYLYDVFVNSGRISGNDFEKNASLFYKTDRANIYVLNGNLRSRFDVKSGLYPLCELCAENEGFIGNRHFSGGNLRSVSLNLGGSDWLMRFIEPISLSHEALIVSGKHDKSAITENTVAAMLDFLEYIPGFVVEATDDPSLLRLGTDHTCFLAGNQSAPMFSLTPDFSAESSKYPDVEISVFNTDSDVISLQSFNRNTLEGLAVDILNAWKSYSDLQNGIFGISGDGVCHNHIGLIARYSRDSRYILDIVLTCEKVGLDYTGAESTVFDDMLDFSSAIGKFVVDYDFSDKYAMMLAVLTRKVPLDDSMFAEGAVLSGYKEFLNGVIADSGYFKDTPKAEPVIKSAILNALTGALIKRTPFVAGDDGIRAFRRFLVGVI